MGMTSHPYFTKGSFPLLCITQNICIRIYHFISFWSICSSWLISCCLVNTSEQLESFLKRRTGSQALRARLMRRGTQRTELRHKAGPEVPKEQGPSTAHDMLLPDETGA